MEAGQFTQLTGQLPTPFLSKASVNKHPTRGSPRAQ